MKGEFTIDFAMVQRATDAIRRVFRGRQPRLGLILGSGWQEAVDWLHPTLRISYAAIPGLGAPTVRGHTGVLLAGRYADGELAVFLGRRHWYEGGGWTAPAIPIYALKALGVGAVLLTNAAGGLRRDLKPGDAMILSDHINAMGVNPLVGHPPAMAGARFPDMSRVYDRRLAGQLARAARRCRVPVKRGIYLAVSGPSYETPAEIRGFRRLGADAVGMSTVPEAILAHAAGLRIAGLSCIANAAARTGASPLTHADVLAGLARALPGLRKLLAAFAELYFTEGEARHA